MTRILTLLLLSSLPLTFPTVAAAGGHSVILEEDPGNPAFPIRNRIYIVGDPGCPVGTVGCYSTRLETALAHPSDPRVDAMSYGRDFGHYKNTHSYFLFSVQCGSGKSAVAKTPLYREPRTECEADIFWVQDRRVLTRKSGTHGKASDENTASPVETSYPRNAFFEVKKSLDLDGTYGKPPRTGTKQMNIQAYDFWDGPDIEGDIYFSIDRTIVVMTPGGPVTLGPADILLLPGHLPALPENIVVYQPAVSLGLHPTADDINGFAFNLQGESFEGMFVQLFAPTAWFTLATGSAHLTGDLSAADIFQFELDAATGTVTLQELHRTGESMGLLRSINTDVDGLGHIDPEVVQSFTNWTDQVMNGMGTLTEEGMLGTSVDESGNVDFGLAFGPYTGSYAISVNHDPLPAEEGVSGPMQLPAPHFQPGDLTIVELAGQKLSRDLIDQVLVEVPSVGNVAPVTNLTGTADPVLGTVEFTWTNGATYDSLEVRFDGELIPTSLAAGTTSVSGPADPGEHFLEVRGVVAGTRSPAEYAIVNLEPTVVQPPHSLDASLISPGAACGGSPNCWDVSVSWENPITYDSVEVFLDDTPVLGLMNCAAMGPCSVVLPNVPSALHRVSVRGIIAGSATISTRVRLFVPIDAPPVVGTPHIPFLPMMPPPIMIPPAQMPFMPGQPSTSFLNIPVPLPDPIGDVNVRLMIFHPDPEALRVVLFHPGGFAVPLVETIGVSGEVIDRVLDGFCDPSPDLDDFGTTAPPAPQGDDLSIFDGQPAAGNWQVLIQNFSPEQGFIQEFELLILPQQPTLDFARGDCNGDAVVNIADPVFVLNVLFVMPGLNPECIDACDGNDDGAFDIGDAVVVLSSLFVPSAPPLPAPGPVCGQDQTPDTLTCFSTICP